MNLPLLTAHFSWPLPFLSLKKDVILPLFPLSPRPPRPTHAANFWQIPITPNFLRANKMQKKTKNKLV